MTNKDILILSSDDWGWKTSKYHISKRLARTNRVLFVSSIGFRSPNATKEHARRVINKLRSFLAGIQTTPEGPLTFTPLVVPFVNFPLRDAINRLLLKAQLKWHFRKLAFRPDFVFIFSQNWYHLLSIFDSKLVYYCVDDQSAFSAIDKSKFSELDTLMSQAADAIFCSSRTLYEAKSANFPNTHYSPHGVEYELFKGAVTDALSVPPDIREIGGPRLLFFGHISYDWVDAHLIKSIAAAKKNWSIILIGRNSMRASEFSDCKNIYVLGERLFEELPAYCAACDIGLIPFVQTTLVNNCNPLKLYEYLSAGLPVVSTPIPEVRGYVGEYVRMADSPAAFIGECEDLLSLATVEQAKFISATMNNQSWSHRIEQIVKVLDDL